MKKFTFLIVFSAGLLLSSCALRSIPSEYNFIQTDHDKVALENLGNGQVLIYNGANILHKMDNTARLNIWLDNKAVGQIRGGEYVVMHLEKAEYLLKLLHIDVVNMRSEHELKIDEDTKVIMVKPTITSNKLEVTNELPKNFEKFSYVTKR